MLLVVSLYVFFEPKLNCKFTKIKSLSLILIIMALIT